MCNFVAQDMNRGSIIHGLPDSSGKNRPMILLNDVRPNDTSSYGMTINLFQIGSNCYNNLSVPIIIRAKTKDTTKERRVSFISTVHTVQFTQAEIFSKDTTFLGICPSEILDLCYRVHSAYISGNSRAISDMQKEVQRMWIEFLTIYPDIPGISYRNTVGDLVEFDVNGNETIVTKSNHVESVKAAIMDETESTAPCSNSKTYIVDSKNMKKSEWPVEHINVLFNKIYKFDNHHGSCEEDKYATSCSTASWKERSFIHKLPNDTLIDFLKRKKMMTGQQLSHAYKLYGKTSSYVRYRSVVDELTSRAKLLNGFGYLNDIQRKYLKGFYPNEFAELL